MEREQRRQRQGERAREPQRLQAAILDWAGTTIDFGCCAPALAFVETFRRSGVELSLAEARGPMGTAKRRHIELLCGLPAVRERWRARHGREPGPEEVERLYREFVPLQTSTLVQHAGLVPGTLDAVADLRRRGLRIGTTTGYSSQMMAVVEAEARRQGYVPDATVCPDDVPAARPHPWMCLRAAQELGVYPMAAIVKVGDTAPDVQEGRNAGMWTVAVAATGNETGFSEAELAALPAADRRRRIEAARLRLGEAGADYVIDGIAELGPVLDDIQGRLQAGELPC